MRDIIALIQSYGPNIAGWVLLFAFVAWAAGKGGKIALHNVKTLLEEGEALRGRMRISLDDCESQIRRRDKMLEDITKRYEESREQVHALKNEMSNMVLEVHRLTDELRRMRLDKGV